MAYKRKTKHVVTIQRFSKCWGWEDVSSYSRPDYERPTQSARADLREYRASGDDAPYRMITSRERIGA